MTHGRTTSDGINTTPVIPGCMANVTPPVTVSTASLAAILVFMLSGLTLRLTLLPLVFLLILINIGYTISASELLGETSVLTWIVTSWSLSFRKQGRVRTVS
jgi:hypothetical protein